MTEPGDGNLTRDYPDGALAGWRGCSHLDCLPECSYARGHCERLGSFPRRSATVEEGPMTRFFDAMDGFFDRLFSGFRGVMLTAVGIVTVIILERATRSTTPMLLLALPGLYMMGRRGRQRRPVRLDHAGDRVHPVDEHRAGAVRRLGPRLPPVPRRAVLDTYGTNPLPAAPGTTHRRCSVKKLLIVACLLVAAPAFAQGPAPAKTTLEFDQQQLVLLGEAISNLPKKIADPFLVDLQRQIDAQKAAADAKAKADVGAAKTPEPEK